MVAGWMVAAPPAGAAVPRPAPDYTIRQIDGKRIPLAAYKGKVVALFFVSTDCPHCQETCRYMEQIQRQYGPRGLQTLAVAFNSMAIMLVQEFVLRSGATYPVGYDERDPVFAFLQRSPRLQTYVPIMVLIDRKGMIREQHTGDDPIFMLDPVKREMVQVRAAIERLLAEQPAAAKKKASPAKSARQGSGVK
jgi:peroxiredoxin